MLACLHVDSHYGSVKRTGSCERERTLRGETVSNETRKDRCLRSQLSATNGCISSTRVVVVLPFRNNNNIVMLHLHFGASFG